MDRDVRLLERAVDADQSDSDARRRLTYERLRAMSGLVIIWVGGSSPHGASVPIVMITTTKSLNSRDPQTFTTQTSGWALAVAGSSDLFDTLASCNGGSVVDLATGRFMSTASSPSVCDFKVESESISLDAFGRPRDTRKLASPIPRVNNINGVVRRHPLYDSEWITDYCRNVTLFQNTRAFAAAGFDPKSSEDTNLYGNGGSLPQDLSYVVTGISMELFDVNRRVLPVDISKVWASDHVLILETGMRIDVQQNARSFLSVPCDRQDAEPVELNICQVPVFPLIVPVNIESQEHLSVRLNQGHGRSNIEPVLCRVTLDGYLRSPTVW